MTKVFVTGASGFIAAELIPCLLRESFEVSGGFRAIADNKFNNKNFKPIQLNIHKYEDVKLAIMNSDLVVHLACTSLPKSIDDPKESFMTNVLGSENIANACSALDIPIIALSTSEVYGPYSELPNSASAELKPNSIYGKNKYLSEEIFLHSSRFMNLKFLIIRLFNIYGSSTPRNTVETIFIKNALAGKRIVINGHHDNSRDFLHINDAINGVIQCIQNFHLLQGYVYNLASGQELKLIDLAKKICELTNQSENLISINQDKIKPERFCADITALCKKINFSPKVSIEAGLRQMIYSQQQS